jgi:hypothetical protein
MTNKDDLKHTDTSTTAAPVLMSSKAGSGAGARNNQSDIEKAFIRLFSGPNWDAFEQEAFKHFDAHPVDTDAHAEFFQYFTPQWRQLCDVGLYAQAENLWSKAVEIAFKWEKMNGVHIHKGTPFYFWGGTALIKGDIDHGFVLIHEAFNEDLLAERSGGRSADTLPAWCLVILKDEEQKQYWGSLVQELAKFLDARISIYNQECRRSLTLPDFKSRFLQSLDFRETAFFFVYSLWKFKQHLDTSQDMTNSSFSTLLQLDTTLNLYVVLEDVLKKYYENGMLNQLIEHFSIKHNLAIHQPPPGEQKKRNELMQERFDADPDTTIRDVLSGNIFHYTQLQTALSIAPRLRNAAAHRVQSYSALNGQTSKLLQTALNTIFAVIDLGP